VSPREGANNPVGRAKIIKAASAVFVIFVFWLLGLDLIVING